MDKEILTFGDIETEKINFTTVRLLFFGRCRYQKSVSI